jgi:hypothetical protein
VHLNIPIESIETTTAESTTTTTAEKIKNQYDEITLVFFQILPYLIGMSVSVLVIVLIMILIASVNKKFKKTMFNFLDSITCIVNCKEKKMKFRFNSKKKKKSNNATANNATANNATANIVTANNATANIVTANNATANIVTANNATSRYNATADNNDLFGIQYASPDSTFASLTSSKFSTSS